MICQILFEKLGTYVSNRVFAWNFDFFYLQLESVFYADSHGIFFLMMLSMLNFNSKFE